MFGKFSCSAVSRFFAVIAFSLLVSVVQVPGQFGFGLFSHAYAASVSKIVVEGNQRIEADTVRAYVTVTPGRSYNASNIDESIKSLFSTGLFEDVQITRSGRRLVVTVRENPIIDQVVFEGNERIKDKSLVLAANSKANSVFSKAQVRTDVKIILEQYRRTGRYKTNIVPKVISLPNNRVNLVFEINEGERTKVARINFIGNRSFNDGRLRDVVQTKETSYFSFFNTSDSYDADRLESDKEALRRFYLRYGYADFRVISAIANLDRERNVFFITFTVDEGERYEFGEINIRSSLLEVDGGELHSELEVSSGDTYNSAKLEKSTEKLIFAISKLGYAFAQVSPNPTRNSAEKTIDVNFSITEGARSYIERINIRGNFKTRDHVIRREFDVAEGDAFNKVLIDSAKRRLERLNFFESVRISFALGGAYDRVVINVDVVEKSTGSFGIGAGYSSSAGAIGEIKFEERNFLGRGQRIKIVVGVGEEKTSQTFSFTEPYFFGHKLAAGFDVFSTKNGSIDNQNYETEQIGFGLRANFRLTENIRINNRYRFFQRETTANDQASTAVEQAEGKDRLSIYDFAVTYDTRDNLIQPRDGEYLQLAQEFAGLGGDVRYSKSVLRASTYHELLPEYNLVGLLKGQVGFLTGLGKDVNILDHFVVGENLVRGFSGNGLGARDIGASGESLGAKYYAAMTAEIRFPAPALPRSLGIGMAAFFDTGITFGNDNKSVVEAGGGTFVDSKSVRASAGLGLLWQSPFGPLRVDFAYPFLADDDDKKQYYNINIANNF